MRLLHNAIDFSLPCFPVYPIRGLTGILLLISNTAQLGGASGDAFSALGIV